jgi:hypothetical protein
MKQLKLINTGKIAFWEGKMLHERGYKQNTARQSNLDVTKSMLQQVLPKKMKLGRSS